MKQILIVVLFTARAITLAGVDKLPTDHRYRQPE